MIALNNHQTTIIAGGADTLTVNETAIDMIQLQYIAATPIHCPFTVKEYTCPVDFLWYCVDQNFGGLCSVAGGGMSTEPDGSITCTIY